MKDEEEKMTELTDSIHSLFRGYVNGFYAHKDAHLCLEKENKKLRESLYEIKKYNGDTTKVGALIQQCLDELDKE